jgi:hypothetical protein
VRGVWVFGWIAVIACSTEGLDNGAQPSGSTWEQELIPAEWTVSEDTSGAGEITTASVQLPAARDIAGLLQDDTPRLMLRCLEGRVVAFIDTDPVDGTVTEDSSERAPPVRVELDAAPSCE